MNKNIINNFLITLLLLTAVRLAPAQTTTQNYILTRTMTDAQGTISSARDVIHYYDGLGREKEIVAKNASPTGYDLVTLFDYDNYGRRRYYKRFSDVQFGQKSDDY